jgi:hypothetical protein
VASDWYVVITDIVGSTKAIELGKYKAVNIIGACSWDDHPFRSESDRIP